MTRILVTGGAGFIGSHTVEALLGRGDEVWVLDNFNDFYDPGIKRANAKLLVDAGARLVEGDIRDEQCLDSLFAEGRFGAVIHLAAMAGVRPSLEAPLLYEDVNVRGSLLLLERIRRAEGCRYVFASSSSVYGSNEQVPFREVDDIHHPVSPYAATKRAGELHAFTYHHLYGIPTTCLRFFTVYGPRQRPEMAIHKFVALALAGEALPFYGDGTTARDYTFIDDIVQGVLGAVDHCEGYEIYNLGESETTTLSELVRGIEEALGVEVTLDRQPMQPGDVVITYADISKARERLGYEPQTLIPDGLARFVEWYRREGPGA